MIVINLPQTDIGRAPLCYIPTNVTKECILEIEEQNSKGQHVMLVFRTRNILVSLLIHFYCACFLALNYIKNCYSKCIE